MASSGDGNTKSQPQPQSQAKAKEDPLAQPPLMLQMSDGFQNPWHCLACDNWNSSRYAKCIKCASDRDSVDGSEAAVEAFAAAKAALEQSAADSAAAAALKKAAEEEAVAKAEADEREALAAKAQPPGHNVKKGGGKRKKSPAAAPQAVVAPASLPTASSSSSSSSSPSTSSSSPKAKPSENATTTRICEYFLKGKCRRRRNCPFLHCLPAEALKIHKAQVVERARALKVRERELEMLEADLARREAMVEKDSSRIAQKEAMLSDQRRELDRAKREVESFRNEYMQAQKQHRAYKHEIEQKDHERKQAVESGHVDFDESVTWQYFRKGAWRGFDPETTRRLERAFRNLEPLVEEDESGAENAKGSSSGAGLPAPSKTQSAVSASSSGPSKKGSSTSSASTTATPRKSQSFSANTPKSPAVDPKECVIANIGDRPYQINVRNFTRIDLKTKQPSRVRRINASGSDFESISGTVSATSIGGVFAGHKLRTFDEVEKFVQNAHVSSAGEVHLKSCMLIQPRKLSYTFRKGNNNQVLFHATSAENAVRIQSGKFIPSSSGMLGRGIYFAKSPQKSAGYFRGGTRTMLLCYVNLDNAKDRGTGAMLEYCVDAPEKCLPLYMLVF